MMWRGDLRALSARAVPSLAPQLEPIFPAMRRELPQGPLQLTCLGAKKSLNGNNSVAEAIYEVKGEAGWAILRVAVQSQDGQTSLTGIYVQRSAVPLRSQNTFSLNDAGVGGWLMLAAMVIAVAVTVAGLFLIWRSGKLARRWLWTIGALVGFTTFRLNWTTGAWSFQPISFQLFSISALKQPIFEPWVLAVSIPLVALIALLRGRGDESRGVNPS